MFGCAGFEKQWWNSLKNSFYASQKISACAQLRPQKAGVFMHSETFPVFCWSCQKRMVVRSTSPPFAESMKTAEGPALPYPGPITPLHFLSATHSGALLAVSAHNITLFDSAYGHTSGSETPARVCVCVQVLWTPVHAKTHNSKQHWPGR